MLAASLLCRPISASDWNLRTAPPPLAAAWSRSGLWTDATLGQVLAAGLSANTRVPFITRSEVHPWSGTFGEVFDLARRVAATLSRQGIGPGDVVAFQLPNWVEAAATFYAATLVGAVVAPIVHFYGPKEVGYILEQSGARVLVAADRFGHMDYVGMLERLGPRIGDLEAVFLVAGDRSAPTSVPPWAQPFSALVGDDAIGAPVTVDPDAPALVAYTSGTTADPKGVIHSHRTIGAEIRQLSGAQAPGSLPTLSGAPVGHGIGMLGALLLPVHRGAPIHMIDVWDPARVLAAMTKEHLASGTGATYFLTSLLDHPDCTDAHLELMHHVGLGGSAVPRAVTERATGLGISIVRMYGSTEHPSITGCTHDDPLEKRLGTDGRALNGCELRIIDEDGRDAPIGTAGEIISRGPDCFVGYTDADLTKVAFDADGWYHTEDVGVLDDDGFLAITDRRKDIIIRGGENVSAQEVEELLLRMPGLAEVAVVAAPDARLGEHACAVLRLLPGAAEPALDEIRAHLDRCGLARQKWPEEVHAVDEFPRTASGKIQKFVLRERLRAGW